MEPLSTYVAPLPASTQRQGSASERGMARIPTAKDPYATEPADLDIGSRSNPKSSTTTVSAEFWPGSDSEDSEEGDRIGRDVKRHSSKSKSRTGSFFRSLITKFSKSSSKGHYFFPADQRERERNFTQHRIVRQVFDGKLQLAPLRYPKRVLDIGTGPGLWALEFAQQHPDCLVVGVDVEPIQPPYTVPNCEFRVLDVRTSWKFQEKFDFIHLRLLGEFPAPIFMTILDTVYQNLAPGGWAEFTEWILHIQCADHSLRGTAFRKWNYNLRSGLRKAGMSASYIVHYHEKLEEKGFTQVTRRKYSVPMNHWPPSEKLQELGSLMSDNVLMAVPAMTLPIFGDVLQWSEEAVHSLIAQVSKDITNPNQHTFMPLMTVFGQKPFEESFSTTTT